LLLYAFSYKCVHILSLSLSLSLSRLTAELHPVHPPLHLRPADVDGQPLHICVRLLQRGHHRQVLQTVCLAEGTGARGKTHAHTLAHTGICTLVHAHTRSHTWLVKEMRMARHALCNCSDT